MLASSYIVPHSPILIPAIGKANSLILDKTTAAYQKIAQQLLEERVETIIVISPHLIMPETGYALNSAPEFKLSFENFGDFATKSQIAGDMALAHELKEALKKDFPLQMTSAEQLDYGSAIPLYLLTSNLKDIKVISLSYSSGNRQAHFDFGQTLKDFIISQPKKIAVLASADLSHRLKRSSPAGYSPKGAKFDNKVIEYLNQPESAAENILRMDDKLVKDAGECGLKAITVILGIFEGLEYEPQVLAYQGDLGVGYLTLALNINE